VNVTLRNLHRPFVAEAEPLFPPSEKVRAIQMLGKYAATVLYYKNLCWTVIARLNPFPSLSKPLNDWISERRA